MLLGMWKSQQGAPELEAPQEARTGAGRGQGVCHSSNSVLSTDSEIRLMTRLLDTGRAEGMWRSQGEAEVGRRGGSLGCSLTSSWPPPPCVASTPAWFFGRGGSCRGAGGGGWGALLSATRPGGRPSLGPGSTWWGDGKEKKKDVGWVGARNE